MKAVVDPLPFVPPMCTAGNFRYRIRRDAGGAWAWFQTNYRTSKWFKSGAVAGGVLLVAWLLGVVGTYTIGAFVHVLLVIAVVLFIVGLLSGRRTIV